MPFLFLLIALVFGSSVAFAAEDVDPLSLDTRETIPLPGQTAYMGEGLSFGLSLGVYDPLAECDCMGAWQAQLEYFYKEWLSGGTNVRFFGGDLDRDVMVLYQRYRLNLRFHSFSDKFDLYAEPFLGFENTSISSFRKQVRGKKVEEQHYWWEKAADTDDEFHKREVEEIEDDSTLAEKDDCQKLFALDGFSIGLGIGGGVNLSRLFGATGEIHVEYNFSKELLLNVMPGVAFNFREVWPWAKRTLRAMWISFEIGGQKTFNRGVDGWSNTYFLGAQLGV
ncbi:hypothetical protein [Fibrobacter sp.]|uniref:hypothetical protein n=1 Tax=Fibrobacter sp. TaxID=35828 RepID=UPI0038672FBA